MKHHFCVCVRGVLQWPNHKLKGMFRKEDGSLSTARETREILMEELSKGHEVLPFSECDALILKLVIMAIRMKFLARKACPVRPEGKW